MPPPPRTPAAPALHGPRTVAMRIDLLGDADPDVRLQMALELGEGRHREAAAALVARFGVERDFAIRETLTWAVLRMPDAALPLVRDALASPRWLARLQAAHTLSKHGAREDGPRLAPLVDDPVDVVAARAWWAVAQCGDPAVVPALVAQLSRGSSTLQHSLTAALAHFGADAAPLLAAAVLRGGTPAIRRHAADTLAYLASPTADNATGATAALHAAVDDPDPDVRIAALNALGHLPSPAAIAAVDEALGAADPRVALLARRLVERRPSAATRRRAALRDRPRHEPDPTPTAEPAAAAAGPVPSAGPWPDPPADLVTLSGGPWAAELVPPLALQVAVCRPRHLARTDVPSEELEEVRAAARAVALAAGRPADLAARIAAGRVEQHLHEHVLLEQVSVADPGVVVADLLRGTEVRITDFARAGPAPTAP